MKISKAILPILLFTAAESFGQNNFTVTPAKPKAGDVININYTATVRGTNTDKDATLKAQVFTLGSKGQTANDLDLKKSGNGYTATVKTDTSDNFVYFSFAQGKNFDNNSNNGYWVQLYDGDSLKKGSDISLSRFYQYYGESAGVENNNDKALQYMEEEFKTDPDARKKNLVQYIRLYSQLHKDEASTKVQKEIESLLKSGLKDEEDYNTIQALYTLAKLPQQAKFIADVKKDKFPEGKWKIGETINTYMRETDIVKKGAMLDDITSKIENNPDWAYLKPSLPFFQSSILNTYQQKGDWDGLDNAIKKYDIKGSTVATIYNNAAWEIQKTGKDLDRAEKMSKASIDIAKREWKTPTEEKPAYLTKSQWDRSRENSYAMYADTYAMINYKLGNYKKGFPYAQEAAIKISKGESADENNTYALLAEKAESPKKYVKQIEKFVKDGKATSDTKDILKRAYIKRHGSDKGYDDYVAALEKDSYLKMVADLKKEVLNDAAPSFTLLDLKGNKVNIADLKNKVVIVDFWATWCGPCKASFPGMQKMVTKYKNDPDVKFVFVDTWETTDKKEKNAGDFIASNKYDFHVLMDNDSKVVEQFKVSGIPTKFVIDKNGVIRFKAIGFDGSDDKLVAELSTMIDMAKTM